MGFGDELMATGQVRAMLAHDPRRVRILDRDKRARWHPLFERNPQIVRPGEAGDFQHLLNGPGVRPYIADKSAERWSWRDFTPTPGRIYFSAVEREYGARFADRIIIEPAIKPKASPNKDWGWARWNKLAWLAEREGLRLSQFDAHGVDPPLGVELIEAPSFRHAAAVLARARAAVLPEGGLHHAAAAVNTPAVVIYGGYISPAQTGYELHTNLFTGGEPCGARAPCEHCRAAMSRIDPVAVMDALLNLLRTTDERSDEDAGSRRRVAAGA